MPNKSEWIFPAAISTAFLFALLIPFYLSFFYYGDDLFDVKYLVVNVLGGCFATVLLFLSIFDIKKGLYGLYGSLPFFTWYKSVFFIEYDFFILDPFITLFVVYLALLFVQVPIRRVSRASGIILGLAVIFGLRFLLSFLGQYPSSDYKFHFIFNEFFEPFIFSTLLFFTWQKFGGAAVIFFDKSFKAMFLTSATILVVEMFFRSGGKPWLFLINGGRRGYSGTSGDLTAGFGEPVTMGLFSAFMIFYFIFVARRRDFSLLLSVLILLSVAKGAMLVSVGMFVSFYVVYGREVWMFINRKYLVLVGLLSTPLLYVIYQRVMGIGLADTITEKQLGGITISSDLNLIRNINSVTSWADPALDLAWYFQFALTPLMGGVRNLVYLNSNIFVFSLGIVLSCYIFYIFVIKGSWYTRIVGCFLLLIYSYYGAFSGTVYSFYFLLDQPAELGYVPRNEPSYLFMLVLVSLLVSMEQLKIRNGLSK